MQKGFIQIPILIMILIGTAVVGGGGYYVAKEISKTSTVETEQEETDNVATNESATSASSTESESVEVYENEDVEGVLETNTQTSIESQSTNSPVGDVSVDTSSAIAVEPPQVNLPKQYPLDQSTENICDDAFEEDDSNSHIKNIIVLCGEADKKKFENKADFDEVIEEIHDEWWSLHTEDIEAELKQAQQRQGSNDDSDEGEVAQTNEQNTTQQSEPEIEEDPYSDYNFSYSYGYVYPDPDWIKRFVIGNTSRDLRITKAVFTISNSDAEKYNSITDPSQPPRVQFCKQQCTGYTLEQINDNTFSYTGSQSSGIPISTGYLYVELPIPAYPEGWITNITIPIDKWGIWDKTTNKPVKTD